MVQGNDRMDVAARWLAGAVRTLQKEVRELKGLLEERQSYEKQLKNAPAVDLKDTTIVAATAIAKRCGKFSVTTETELAESSVGFYVEIGEARPPGAENYRAMTGFEFAADEDSPPGSAKCGATAAARLFGGGEARPPRIAPLVSMTRAEEENWAARDIQRRWKWARKWGWTRATW